MVWRRVGRILLILSIVLLVALLIGPFLVPVPATDQLATAAELAEPDGRFVDLPYAGDMLTVHYEEAGGSKQNLLLLHGFAASTFSWREVLAPLAEFGRTVAYDRPAFGLTERPLPGEWSGPSPYSAAAQADQTVALMDKLGIDQAVLVGNSAGGTIATLTALQHPDRVKALILVDPAIYAGGGTPGFLRPLFQAPQMRHLGPLITRRIQEWGYEFGRSAWHDPARFTDEIWTGYQKPLKAENWDRALFELTRASKPLGLPDRLDEIKVPTLVITGDDDRIVPTEQSIRLASEIPGAELVVIPQCGHVPHEECPEAFLQATHAFLSQFETTAAP